MLESAYFLPASVRRTARKLNLPSDASYRFERGVDPGMILRASQRAAQLIREIAGGQPASETITAGTLPRAAAGFALRYERCDELARRHGCASGWRIEILEGFGLEKTEARRTRQSSWRIPSYRSDLRREVDLIEEIVRVFGINSIAGVDRSRFTPVRASRSPLRF